MAKLRTNSKKEEVEAVEVVEAEVVKATAKVEKAETIDVIDKAVATAATISVAEIATNVPKTEPSVRICTNQDVRTYIGDQWYNLKAGKQVSVPLTVKEKLRKAGYLTAL